MRGLLSSGVHAILEVLFPKCCPACHRKLLDDEQVICKDCLDSIARTEHMLLEQNGIDLLFLEHIQKQRRTVRYERGAAFAYYNRDRGKVIRQLIERGKYGARANAEIFYALGRLVAQENLDSDMWDDVDYLVPVPLHPRRLRERGFNQAEWICRGMSEVLHIPVDTSHLVRVKNNPHQSRSQFDRREKNVEDIFAIRYPEEWKKKHILLVDDVITSGSTMFSCIKHTTPIRGCRVSVFSLGWAHK